MDGGIGGAADAAATMATGTLLAREAERAHAPGHDPSEACANCGTPLAGPFCHACGQHGHVHRTAGALLHDLLHGVFHFEGKFWATLPMLVWRPGELTRRYVHGERAQFVSPVALFLFSVFLMFAIVSNLPNMAIGKGAFADGKVNLQTAREKLADEQRKAAGDIVRLERQLARERASTPVMPQEVAAVEKELATSKAAQRDLAKAAGLLARSNPGKDRIRLKTNSSWLDQRWRHAKQNPELLLYKIKSSAYKWSWALIPLSLPFIWLLFPLRREVGMYDHAIFATYSLSFMSLLVVVLGLLSWIGVPTAPLALAGMVIPILHIYRQLKDAYRLSRLGAIWRTWLMLWFICFIVPLFAVMLLYLGVAD